MLKKFLAGILAAASLLLLIGCGAANVKNAEEKTFSAEGMNITLTEKFTKKSTNGFTVCFDSSEVAVFALKETVDDLSSVSLSDYVALIRDANASKSPGDIETIDGIPSMEYTFTSDSVEYKYLAFMYKAPDAFWTIQFACKTADYEEDKPYFIKWAKTVSFDGAETNG